MKRVLLTGATGFVGQHLQPALSGHALRAAVRDASNKATSTCERVAIGDISQLTDWSAAVKNIDCVVHMAALVHVMSPTVEDRRRFHEVNVLGTERLALAAAEAGVKRFVYLSSVKVNGEATYGKPFTAADTANPVDDYGISKYAAEQKLFEIARRFDMQAVVIRPPLVYGPGVRANFMRLLAWIHKGTPLPFGAIRNARSLVSVWNLCDLVKCVVEKTAVSSGVLMVSDGLDLSTPDLVRRLAAPMDRSPRLLSVPVSILKLGGLVAGRSGEIARLCGSLTVDIEATKRQMDWAPPLSIDEGFARTVRWYLKEMSGKGV